MFLEIILTPLDAVQPPLKWHKYELSSTKRNTLPGKLQVQVRHGFTNREFYLLCLDKSYEESSLQYFQIYQKYFVKIEIRTQNFPQIKQQRWIVAMG